jgi:hypothetical protein
VAHATGIGFVGPPGLKMRNFKTVASGWDEINSLLESEFSETGGEQSSYPG